jgi:hypothetical protein
MCPAAGSDRGGGFREGAFPVKKIAVRVTTIAGGLAALLLAGGAWVTR